MKKYLLLTFLIFINVIGITLAKDSKSKKSTYVILISFDGFRWDYTERGITPNLDKLIREGVKASSLQPVYPSKTFPNHYSIITGCYPQNHGITGNEILNPFNNEKYKVGDSSKVRDPRWYLGEAFWETARRNDIITASYFWPGSELTAEYRRPNYYHKYEHKRPYETRLNGIMDWLTLPEETRPSFITLYFDATDSYGHNHGTNSQELNSSVKLLDDITGKLLTKLDSIGMKDNVNLIFVSDHGMYDIDTSKSINISQILQGYEFAYDGIGPNMMILPKDGQLQDIYDILKKNEKNYKVYLKNEIPEHFHFRDNPFILPILIVGDLGADLVLDETKTNRYETYKATHGYDNHDLNMHGIFIANGPLFRKNYKTGTLLNIDIYPLLCDIFDISPRNNIDGKADRINFILK